MSDNFSDNNNALKESEIRFQQIANTLPLVVWTAAPDGNLTYISDQWEKIYGNPVHKSLGTGWAAFVHPDDVADAAGKWADSLSTGENYETEFRVQHKEGNYHWILVRAVPIKDAEGKITNWYGSNTDIEDKKKNENNIKENEEKLRSVVESAPFPIGVYTGKEMRIALANKSIMDVWGKGYDIIGKLYAEILPELENQTIFQQLDEVFTTGISFHAKNTRVDIEIGGKLQPYWFNYSFTPLFDAAGKVYGVMNTAAEVTDLNLAQNALLQSEQRIRSLVDNAPYPIGVYTGEDLTISMANPTILKIWGADENAIGKTYEQVRGKGGGNEEVISQLKDVFRSGEPISVVNARRDIIKNGIKEDGYFNYSFIPLFDNDQKVYGVMSIAADVTDLNIARMLAKEIENNLRNTILKAPVAMCLLKGPRHLIDIANEKIIELWGKPVTDVMNKTVEEALPEVKEQGFIDLLDNVYNTGETFSAQHVPVTLERNEKPENIFVNFVYAAQKDVSGNISGIVVVAIDVTAEVLARQQIEEIVSERTMELAEANINLQKSNSDLAQFAHIASHDLQEPLRKITVFSQMLQNHLGDTDAVAQNFLTKINTASSRMISLIRDVLDFSELSRGNEIFKKVNLEDVLEGIRSDFELLVEQKDALVSVTDMPVIEAIPLQMSQLFGNLISNSLKFSRKDRRPEISISAKEVKAEELAQYPFADRKNIYYNIEFRDNGIGFEPKHAEQVFNIFQRLHGKAEYSGTGIGLAMCKKIAQNHHGDIFATATDESGAVFNIILPATQQKT